MAGATPIPGDIVQMRVQCSANFQISLNVLHYQVLGVVGGGITLSQMATAMVAILAPVYRPLMPITAQMDHIEFKNLMFPETVAYRAVANLAGTALGDLVPTQVSCLIGWQTALAGRANRGRNYIGLISETFTDTNGQFDGAGFALLTNIAAALGPNIFPTAAGASTNCKLVVRHANLPGPPPVPIGTQVVAAVPSTRFATQRRRGDYGARNL